MEKLLISGINTRPMINSGLKLDYDIYSTSYYSTYDFNEIKNEKYLLNQQKNKSCGYLETNYTKDKLLKLSKDYLEEVDYIIPVSGLDYSDFSGEFKKFRKKIIGNKKIENINNKFNFFNKIKNKYLVPETFKVNNVDELIEILKNSEDKQYIVKPLKGFGGVGVNFLNKEKTNQLNDMEIEWLIQEYIDGNNISSSTLSTKNNSKTIINSRNLNENDYNKEKNFIYNGNILPLDKNTLKRESSDKIIKEMSEISEDIVKEFNLIGSNGVDYIVDNQDQIYLLEINPRFQGTYECCEKVLKINMLDAHLKAFNGELININDPEGYCIKKIIYSQNKVKVNNLSKYKNIYDTPYPEVIIEKDEPIATILHNNKNLKTLYNNLKISSNRLKMNTHQI
ncbi:MAG: ATP-grasp domain-containing protein [Methanobacteriaceae archaeon]|jgi:hypothetical protein|nr:ATP-grasp domain-containing protein [Methanobacteriaceae archaeon]